jgi:rod shape determining protein RodA
LLIGIGSLVAFFGWNFFVADYQKERVSYFLHPEKDPLGKGYNAIQVKITVGSGSFFGNGLGQGGQTRLAFLPERHSDFIFATLAESFGFAGITVVVSLYFLIFWQIYRILASTDNDYHHLIVLGIGFYLWLQLAINIGMNLGVLPITGLALPLFSSGGSSLLSTMIGLSLISKSQT